MIEKLLYPAHKVSEIPKPVREYLTKNQRPDSKSAEDVVQTWFNGLMKVSSSAWKSKGFCPHLCPYDFGSKETKKYIRFI
ncbi:hypothetical protein RhiirA5_427162 [Rhizophagus irregularis]|uniref:Uncharacterized protein n=1 Tax=Rhizophagus irregularis TaxID=588596 RepID=A0A2N0P2Y8_9GLOM|nr:hypothetical protein RhiirA5_427162 [Rhizophagus irregularis]